VTAERQFLGEWRQIRPDPRPASILITFESGGRVVYTIEMGTVQILELTWRLDGEQLVVNQSGAPTVISRFRFQSPTMLVLERDGERSVYVRS
jgi:hypothetical protein